MDETELTGRTLGGYRILRKLGQGGMSTVYKAHEESLNRVVALKVIARHLSTQDEFIERFRREARAVAALSHPNIVQIYAIGEDDGIQYFAMEYVKGRSLAEVIVGDGSLPPPRAVRIVRQVAEALSAAHDAGIVHRDIKPANIMLDEADRVRVTDFGISQTFSETRLTQVGMMVGTPEYLSPEQYKGQESDARSDIYALGIVFFQMLAGRTPYKAETPGALALQVVQGQRPVLTELNPSVSAELQAVVEKMIATDPARRYQSSHEVLAVLRRIEQRAATDVVPGLGYAAAGDPALEATEIVGSDAPPVDAAQPPAAQPPPQPPPPSPGASPMRQTSTKGQTWAALGVVAVLVLAMLLWQLWPFGGEDAGTVQADAVAARPVDDVAPPEAASAAGDVAPPEAASDVTTPGPGPAAAPGVADAGGDESVATASTTNDRSTDGSEKLVAGTPSPPGESVPARPPAVAPAVPVGGGAAAGKGPTASVPPTQIEAPAAVPVAEPVAGARDAPPVAGPPSDSVLVSTVGDYEYNDLVQAWVEAAFSRAGFQLVDSAQARGRILEEVAAYELSSTATLVSTRRLEFFGRTDTQYTVALTMRAVALATGAIVAGPESTTVEYTAINLQENLRAGTETLTNRLARELRRIAGP